MRAWVWLLGIIFIISVIAGCSEGGGALSANSGAEKKEAEVTLVIGAYSVVKDAFHELLPLFAADWYERTGQRVSFQQSYEASGTQARSIAGGFEADVAVLAMESDLDLIEAAGYLNHDWRAGSNGGMITNSIVVLGTRSGNPLGISDWLDLTRDGVKVLYPNPKTSGGAQWDINAIYGAGLKKSEEATGEQSHEAAKKLLASIHRNVESLDKSGRASMAAFEYGVGDVIVTYENELLARMAKGTPYEIVIPKHTILIENPAAVIDRNVDKRGTREVAEAFIAYLQGEEAQRLLAQQGFRPVHEVVAAEAESRFETPEGLFDIAYMGGWTQVREKLYAKRGVWYQILAGIQ
ncbi:sulfate ABC transporter substrate-binding protein [Paenibacillus sp. J5C_2022]|uniref:sulfate ABC transporter substrate-binding protein n=1 Tax=Paenibacillus sp. J5C2022 TaxID=2977129 RepID=UPI0021D3C821|nr:sulfate ABC transporter substrate-binding protein [Paenibacillus sp. J5C2022]MCU6710892.1 sulfate ABC transporter substrate-binding protein [Paenibacillus sp. J5C2022]